MIEQTELEQLAKTVDSISNAVKKIKESGIGEDALLTLIQRNCKGCIGRANSKPNKKVIRTIIEGMESLTHYVFPESE